MRNNIILDKSFKFAVDIVALYKLLIVKNKEFVLSKQILRSGTSIGANIREAQNAQSKRDFIRKLGIAQKESDETLYWLDILKEANYVNTPTYDTFSAQCTELLKLLRSITISTKKTAPL